MKCDHDWLPAFGYCAKCGITKEAANGGWQPIETAPKDGTFILIAENGILPDVVQWLKSTEDRVIYGNLHLGRPSGWFNVSRSRLSSPTHWMPLPEPPQ